MMKRKQNDRPNKREGRSGKGEELFILDEDGNKQDASIHEDILAQGRDDPAAFEALAKELGLPNLVSGKGKGTSLAERWKKDEPDFQVVKKKS
jgi:hypothetical protein